MEPERAPPPPPTARAAPAPVRRERAGPWLSMFLGLWLIPPVWVIGSLALGDLSPSGHAVWLGLALICAGWLTAPFRWERAFGPSRLGLVLIAGTLVLRLFTIGSGPHGRLTVLPADSGPRWVNRVLEERDVVLLAERMARRVQVLDADESAALDDALRTAYDRLDARDPGLGSPVLATLLGEQSASAHDTLVLEPDGPVRGGVIFLHGYAGSFTVQCWQLAEAAREAGAVTVCPSVGMSGDWWAQEATVRHSIAFLQRRGVERIVLAGLSNGGLGASLLAPRLRRSLVGLVLISGAAPSAGPPGVPALVVQGTEDSMTPERAARAYAQRGGRAVRYEPLPGTHFLFLESADAVRARIARFLVARFPAR